MEALRLQHRVTSRALTPNEISYGAAIGACEKGAAQTTAMEAAESASQEDEQFALLLGSLFGDVEAAAATPLSPPVAPSSYYYYQH